MIKIIGCNNHLGVGEKGLTHNINKIQEVNPNLTIEFIEEVIKDEVYNPTFKNENSVYATSHKLAHACNDAIESGFVPLNVLGDHAASVGTCAASSNHAENLGILWVDAHSDINTPHTTPSGNIHGMTNAISLNLFENKLNNILFDGPKVKPENLAMIGLRDIDPGELDILKEHNIAYYTYDMVEELGLDYILQKLNQKFKNNDKLHLSIDMDSMDPTIVSAVSVPVDKGFTPQQVIQIVDSLAQDNDIISVDIVEYNPEYDKDNQSLTVLIDLIEHIKSRY